MPPRSLLLGAYLAWSNGAERYGNRKLKSRLAQGKEDAARLEERRGIASLPRPDGPLIWFHAASVGESVSLLEMIRRIGEERPDTHFLITSGTVTSAEILASRLPPRALHQYVPLDVRPWMRRFLDHWRPDLCVLAEGEIWPALLHECAARGVPVALINARMTEGAHRRWRRWARGAARALVHRIAHVQAQDRATADRLLDLGFPPERLEVTGTLKEGSKALPHDESQRVALAGALAGRPCWLAASTHEGEEAGAAEAHAQARRAWQKLLLVIAPRHPDRATEIVEGLRLDGWRVARRTAGETIEPDTEIYVADTIGEMGLWYRLCPVSFVGGSLVEIGGHNPFEPAALGSAILHGPHVQNFADIYERLGAAGAARSVSDWDDLGATLARVLEPDEAARMAHAAWEVCSAGAEVTEAAMDLLLAMLDGVD
ncbi:3-deoxy-D-manno-octulosonic acid transferase [Jannaschia seohaensis]|uniref:3-deoxy-D-manno-octulosonic acid transferase n=1 Tax=Jannaschia seohaensis TaxID=475081 RepID=A0A2Y9ASR7_9RHOB|nr:3-deoxy-D-manno-octulosonic acid transferase [Jannaschia seohaensis]PWJ17427.1 3-deoxy-D-manno-octulosonic-acid transferase [Jannaschia seohaensis]SSA47490.1 3-deoxy-D-manno-octulosonic-acid transferase [Jannaschia seohaensis]